MQRGFNSWSHWVTMIFSQFSCSVSLRQISEGLQSATGNLNHLGLSRAPSKSNIGYQNAHRTSSFFEDVFYALFQYLGQHGELKQMKKRMKAKVFLLDSTVSREKRRIARKRMENKKEVGLLSKSVRPPLLQRLKFTEYGSGIQSTKNPCGFA